MKNVKFVPGKKLNRLFFEKKVKPLLKKYFPQLNYSAALIGYGSDVLGYDTPISRDHNWGPRLQLFLSEKSYIKYYEEIDFKLKNNLPQTFMGYSVNFSKKNLKDGGTQKQEPRKKGPINHLIEIFTVKSFFNDNIGIDITKRFKVNSWLAFPEEKLIEIKSGAIYYDSTNKLTNAQKMFNFFPHDVWLYKMACQWQRISQEEAFIGRCNDVNDFIGMKIVSSRIIFDIIKLCFLMEKEYTPYNKWMGSAFNKLKCSKKLKPFINAVLIATNYEEIEEPMIKLYSVIGNMHNQLNITKKISNKISNFFDRPYKVIFADRYAKAISLEIKNSKINKLKAYIGGLDQFIDCTDFITNSNLCKKAQALLF